MALQHLVYFMKFTRNCYIPGRCRESIGEIKEYNRMLYQSFDWMYGGLAPVYFFWRHCTVNKGQSTIINEVHCLG
jgi:hypothetical protein